MNKTIKSVRIAALHHGMDEMMEVGRNGVVKIRDAGNESESGEVYTSYISEDANGNDMRMFENCSVEVVYDTK